MSKAPADNPASSLARRSGLPRLTSNFPSVLHSRSRGSDPNLSEPFLPHPSPLSRFQPLALKRVFSSQSSNKERNQEPSRGIGCTPRSSKSSCGSWIPSFHSRASTSSHSWGLKSPEDTEFGETWRDETSTFSKQLAKITRGSDEDLWTSCRPCLSVPRPAWPADGSHSGTEDKRVTKECIGRKVLIGGKEEGILRYFGRTAFSSGYWCGIELDGPVGKNNGSVDGVIYFSCAPGHGIFAPDSKVSLLEYPEIQMSMKNSKYGSGSRDSTIYRLSAASSSSSSSGLSGHSNDSKRSSSGSTATYTIVGRDDDSMPSTPNDSKTLKQFREYSACETDGSSEPVSPETGTCDDSSLGILTPSQMGELTVTASASFERSPSDENVAALEDEVCDELGAVGGNVDRWGSQGSISGIEEEIIQRDVSAIIMELTKKESDSTSSHSSDPKMVYSKDVKIHPERKQCRGEDLESQFLKGKPLAENATIILEKVNSSHKDHYTSTEKVNMSPQSLGSKSNLDKVSRTVKGEPDTDASEWQSGVSNMTTSAASLDQGYQGDGEFDVPSEAGSATASSPTEDPQVFEGVIDIERISLDHTSSAATEADVSLADDETESENGVIPRDRSARIIDGKLYHSHKELVALRQSEGRHDAHTSEMDSSGFYSDLDHRDDESTRMEVPSLQPLKESKLDVDMHDSVLDDTTQADELEEEYATVTKPSDIVKEALHKVLSNEDSSLMDEDDKSSTCTIRSELKDLSSSDNNPCVPSDSSISYSDQKVSHSVSSTNQEPEIHEKFNNHAAKDNVESNIESQPSGEQTPEIKEPSCDNTSPSDASSVTKNESTDAVVPAKPRNYDKPWLSKPTTPRKVDKPKIILPPPPPMPKKNVQSKLKALLEASEPSPEDRRPRQPKKGRWDEVMSRIEEGKKEEKVRPKVKEVKSRLMDALKTPQPASPQVERIRQERRERRERRERQAAASAVIRRMSDRKRSVASSRPSRAPSLDSLGCVNPSNDSRSSTPEVSQISTSSNEKKRQISRHSKIDNPKTTLTKNLRAATVTRTKPQDPVKVLRPAAPPSQPPAQGVPHGGSEELKRLEAELSERTEEARSAKQEATRTGRGLEALTVLLHHLTNEYDAFSTPKLKCEIERLTTQLTDIRLCLDESSASTRRLQDEAEERCQKHAEEIEKLEEAHSQQISSINLNHQKKMEEVLEKHEQELKEILAKETETHEELIRSHKEELERIESEWRSQMDKQHERHLQALEQLNTCHTQQLKEAERSWDCREKDLEGTNARLIKEQTVLRQQAKKLEETLLSDKDHRLQAAKRVCTALQNEVDSLKTVVEMRNSEVHKLRDQLADKERISEDLDAARERVRSLQAKTEDLLAQMEKKLQLERQLVADHHSLANSLQREESVNKRLSLENEELQWKLRQREAAAAGSLPTSTLDLVTRCSTAIAQEQEGGKCGGGIAPQFTPRSRIGTKSHDKKWSQSFTNIPEDAGKLFRRTELQHHDDLTLESPPLSPRVKAVIEKSNSVSFILDLNDTFPEDPFLGISPQQSPHHASKPRTPILQRKTLRKTFSNLEKSSSTSKIHGNSKVLMTTSLRGPEVNGQRHTNGTQKDMNGDSCCDGQKKEDQDRNHSSTDHSSSSRDHSPSESSDGGDVERISPTGLAWTVPVHSNMKRFSKHIPNRFHQVVPEPPRLLQQPDEDEYEEMENGNEFVEVLTLGDDLSSAPLTTLFAQTPSTSVSLSDSDISQCGSRADLSTEDDDCSEDDDGTLLQKESQSRPQEGAGEAMIFPDGFELKAEKGIEAVKNGCKEIAKSQISSAPSSDSEDVNHQPMNDDTGLNMSWSEDVECDLTSSSEMQELL